MIRFYIVTTLIMLSFAARSQEKVTLNGYVKDASNGEELIGVAVYLPELKAGTVTNAYGFYAITVPKGTYQLQFSYLGYVTQSLTVELNADLSKNIELAPEAEVME